MSLVAFDFDGTLTSVEMTVVLGRLVGAEAEMAAITEEAMNGERSYPESLRARVALLEGLSEPAVDEALSAVQLRAGAAEVLAELAEADVRVAILTGGFERGVRAALDDAAASVDRIVANRLVAADGALTGEVTGPLVEGAKRDQLERLAAEFDVPLGETVAVGDGANDRDLLEAAGLAIGFRPKPVLRDVLDASVETMADLEATLRRRGVLPTEPTG